jgi:hypothetical protein
MKYERPKLKKAQHFRVVHPWKPKQGIDLDKNQLFFPYIYDDRGEVVGLGKMEVINRKRDQNVE